MSVSLSAICYCSDFRKPVRIERSAVIMSFFFRISSFVFWMVGEKMLGGHFWENGESWGSFSFWETVDVDGTSGVSKRVIKSSIDLLRGFPCGLKTAQSLQPRLKAHEKIFWSSDTPHRHECYSRRWEGLFCEKERMKLIKFWGQCYVVWRRRRNVVEKMS